MANFNILAMESLTTDNMHIEGLYEAGRRAHYHTSFDPDKRGEQVVETYESELNDDIINIPDNEREQYISGYKLHLFSWLSAKSRCLSSMITGPANFPVRRAEKANQTEHNRYEDFRQWRDRSFKAINKRTEAAKSPEQKTDERWTALKKELWQKMEWRSVANTFAMVERLAYNGEIELVNNAIELIKEFNGSHSAPFITDRHKMWSLPEIATKAQENKQQQAQKENQDTIVNGVKVVYNYQADRIQLFFDGKPEQSKIQQLKHSAFKWSPSNGCWQRQLTNNAVYATKKLLESI